MRYKISVLVAVTGIYYLLPSVNSIRNGEIANEFRFLWNFNSFVNSLGSFIAFSCMAIVSYSILYGFFARRKYFIIALVSIIALPVTIAFRYGLQEIFFFHLLGIRNYKLDISWVDYFNDNYAFAIVYMGIGAIYFFIQLAFHSEKNKRQLEVATEQSKLKFLRSQVNPHFLFNSLNNIYAQVYQKSPHALASIDKLSTMLRYSIYQKEQWVSVEEEKDHIMRFIELEEMRHDYKLHFKVISDTEVSQLKVPPLIFFNYVENAFKHGELNDAKYPITVAWRTDSQWIYFKCINKISNHRKDSNGGIGNQNTRERLALIYKEMHQLEELIKGETYSVNIKLPIKK